MREDIAKVVARIGKYVGQGLTSKEVNQYTNHILDIIKRNDCG